MKQRRSYEGTKARRALRIARDGIVTLALSVGAFLLLAPAALAQTAGMMSFQAVLKDGGGNPIPNGPVTLEIEIFDASSGGAKLDANGDGSVNAADTFIVPTTAVEGVISIKYGPIAPSVFGPTSRWLNVNVTSPVLPPLTRVEIVTPPAIAEQINRPGTGTPALIVKPDGKVGIGVANPSGSLDIWGAFRSLNGIISRPNGPTCFNMAGGNGIQTWHFGHFQFKSDAGDFLAEVTDSGSVVVGRTNSAGVLEVRRELPPSTFAPLLNLVGFFTTGGPDQGQSIDFRVNTSAGGYPAAQITQSLSAGVGGVLSFRTADHYEAGAPIDRMTIRADGKVGIGTASPLSRLHVSDGGPPGTATEAIIETSNVGTAATLTFSRAETPRKRIQLGAGDHLEIFQGTGSNAIPANRLFARFQSAGTIFFGGNVGIGTPAAHELTVNGTICSTSGTVQACSDARFKTNIERVGGGLALLESLRPVRFDWRRAEFPDRRFDDQRQVGFIAQELLNVLPEVVQRGGDGYYSVDYGRLTPLLTAAIQELHAKHTAETGALNSEVSNLKSEISELKSQISDHESRDRAQAATIDDLARRLAKIEAQLAAAPAAGGR